MIATSAAFQDPAFCHQLIETRFTLKDLNDLMTFRRTKIPCLDMHARQLIASQGKPTEIGMMYMLFLLRQGCSRCLSVRDEFYRFMAFCNDAEKMYDHTRELIENPEGRLRQGRVIMTSMGELMNLIEGFRDVLVMAGNAPDPRLFEAGVAEVLLIFRAATLE